MTALHIAGNVAIILAVIFLTLNWLELDYKWWRNKLHKEKQK